MYKMDVMVVRKSGKPILVKGIRFYVRAAFIMVLRDEFPDMESWIPLY